MKGASGSFVDSKDTEKHAGRTLSDRFNDIRLRVADFPEVVVIVTFTFVFLFFTFNTDDFLAGYAISNFLTFGGINGVIVVGVAFLMISGEFDISVGSTMAVAMYVLMLLLLAQVPALAAIFLALLVAALLGLVNGLIVVNTTIPSFIVTLGTLLAYRGLARFLGQGRLINYPEEQRSELFTYLNGQLTWFNDLFVPAGNFRVSIIWFIGLTIIMTIVLKRTRFGNWTYAAGGNPGAAISQGVNVKRVKLINFILSSLLAGFAGMLFFAQRFSVNALTGAGIELIAVAAAVIGGVRLTGGYGTIIGASVGIILLNMLEQGLSSMGVAHEIFQAVAGAIIIIAVISNTYIGKQD
jgi:simple sugar transport system permease protein